jgi:adenylosuccinate lyase
MTYGMFGDKFTPPEMKDVQKAKSFLDVIQEDPQIRETFSPEQFRQMMDPSSHTGLASEVVDRVLSVLRK